MPKIPDVVINEVIGNQGRYALDNTNTGVNYARPVSSGVDVSGLAQGLAQASQGVMQFNQNEQRNQYIQQQQQEQQALQAEKIAKEREVAKMRIDKADSDAYMLGNKTDMLVALNGLKKEASNQKTPEEVQSFLFKGVDKLNEDYAKNAPNEVAKQKIKGYLEAYKQGSIGDVASQFAQNKATQNKAHLQKFTNDNKQAVINGQYGWKDGINNLTETLNESLSFITPEKAQEIYDKGVIDIKTSNFDSLMMNEDYPSASALLKDKEYTQGLGKDILYGQQQALQKAAIKERKLQETDPVGWADKRMQNPTIEDKIAIQLELQKQTNIPNPNPDIARVMSDDDVKNFKTALLSAGNEDDFINTVNQTHQKFGSYWKNVLNNDLSTVDIPDNIRFAMNLDPLQPNEADAMAKLFKTFKQSKDNKNPDDLFKQKRKINATDMTTFESELYTAMQPLTEAMLNGGYNNEQMSDASKMALAIAKSYYVDEQDKAKSIDFALKAMESGRQYVETGGGMTVAVPDYYDATQIKNGLDIIMDTTDIGAEYQKLYKNNRITNFLSSNAREYAYWIPYGDGMQLMYGGKGGDAIRRFVPDKDGNPIVFSYEDIVKKSKQADNNFTEKNKYKPIIGIGN